MVDIKPRSRDVTDGLEKTAARGMLRAVGMGDDVWEKPQVGVATSWNGVTACKLTIRVRPFKPGCEAEVTYSHTSLGPEGDVYIASFTAERDR